MSIKPTSRLKGLRYVGKNWSAYDHALRRRGDVTFWISEQAVAAWLKSDKRTAGGDPVYADLAIETVLMVRTVFHLPLRQAEGFVAAVFGLMGVELPVPDHTTLSQRGPALHLNLPAVPPPGRWRSWSTAPDCVCRGQIGPQGTLSQDGRQAPRLAQAASNHGCRLGPICRLRSDRPAPRRLRRPA
jgi:hypothetical protein